MAINISDPTEVNAKVLKFLTEFPGDLICARQIWYEGLEGHGAASPEAVAAIENAITAAPSWSHIGQAHYEKFGNQNSWRKA